MKSYASRSKIKPADQEVPAKSHAFPSLLSAPLDQRPEAGRQRALQALADRSSQARQLASLQDIADSSPRVQAQATRQRLADERLNKTGMPDKLKSGLEQLSGLDLSGVRVHRNSAKPAQLNARAYAQGRDIHLGPGQERHLPHEGWHVVQQMQGRVRPTKQIKGAQINDDLGLEHEASVMGAKALQLREIEEGGTRQFASLKQDIVNPQTGTIQLGADVVVTAAKPTQSERECADAVAALLKDNLTVELRDPSGGRGGSGGSTSDIAVWADYEDEEMRSIRMTIDVYTPNSSTSAANISGNVGSKLSSQAQGVVVDLRNLPQSKREATKAKIEKDNSKAGKLYFLM